MATNSSNSSVRASMAFTFHEALLAGYLDDHLVKLAQALHERQALYNQRKPPPLTAEMVESGHQVWAWMNGPGRPHWEVRGTGVLVPDHRRGEAT